MSRPEPAVSLRCDDGEWGCGITFLATPRHARKIRDRLHPQLCRRCSGSRRARVPHEEPCDDDFRFWLDLFSDDELAELCSYAFGVEDRTLQIAARRAALIELEAPLALIG